MLAFAFWLETRKTPYKKEGQNTKIDCVDFYITNYGKGVATDLQFMIELKV